LQDKTKISEAKKTIDSVKVSEAIQMLISALGDDPNRPGLLETPERAARMYMEMFEGINYTNDEIAEMFSKCFKDAKANDWVLVKDINIFSFCEHHFALMYNMKAHIAYKPKDKVIGLSKIARIASMAAKRLQLQERIGCDISEILQKVLNTPDVMVVIEGEHSCMSARGIRAEGSKTRTCCANGIFSTDASLRQEILSQI
jgi:GTP cyclohydrolase I